MSRSSAAPAGKPADTAFRALVLGGGHAPGRYLCRRISGVALAGRREDRRIIERNHHRCSYRRHSDLVAMRAPSRNAANFAQITVGCTSGR